MLPLLLYRAMVVLHVGSTEPTYLQ
jgi:hypothetical protein